MQHGLTVQVKENERKKRMTIDAFKQYNPLRLAYLVVCSANEIYSSRAAISKYALQACVFPLFNHHCVFSLAMFLKNITVFVYY